MRWTSIAAIYSLFWVMSAFLVLPFGVRTADEAQVEKVPGQAESAPAEWRPARIAKRATVLSALLFGLFYANYTFGWLTPQNLDYVNPPTDFVRKQ